MSSSILKSFAKINIGLKIINRREDGFHNIETIFYPVKLHDTISISIEPFAEDHNSVRIHSDKHFLPTDKKNICYKTIEAFFVAFSIKDHFIIDINIHKEVPVGGGLGGGSSNSASILKYLIGYFKININENREKILNVALSCGSDVPFFLIHKPCFAEGRGEKMRILKDFKLDYDILLVNPHIHVSTRWAFEHLNYELNKIHPSDLNKAKTFDPSQPEIYKNDFEDIVFPRHLELQKIKEELLEMGAVFASMSGTGATMYGLFEGYNKAALQQAIDHFRSKNFFVHL